VSRTYRTIRGSRQDLHRVRDPGAVVNLDLVGVASLAGIERMTGVEQLLLERVPAPELWRLEQLPRLRKLVIDRPVAPIDYQPIERLHGLVSLAVLTGPADAAALARLDLSGLGSLEVLEFAAEGAAEEANLPWYPLPRLGRLTLEGFRLSDAVLERVVSRGDHLRQLLFEPVSRAQLQRARDGLPGRQVQDLREGVAALGQVLEHGGRFSVGLDLASDLGLETNYEAEDRLRAELAARREPYAARLGFDTEAGAVWVTSDRRADLLRVLRLAECLSEGDGEPANDPTPG
jgi:hypothetical protein